MNCAGGLLGQQVRAWMAMKYSGEINPDYAIRDGLGVARRRGRVEGLGRQVRGFRVLRGVRAEGSRKA